MKVSLEVDRRFWALLPTFSINLYSRTLEIGWLFVAVYFDFE